MSSDTSSLWWNTYFKDLLRNCLLWNITYDIICDLKNFRDVGELLAYAGDLTVTVKAESGTEIKLHTNVEPSLIRDWNSGSSPLNKQKRKLDQ